MLSNKNNGMYAPDYYKDFKCTADKCRHSCCVDWEICIDKFTYEKYLNIDEISSTVTNDGFGPYFALQKDGRCPHLNSQGLCDIILNHGEDYLSEICRNHPRFFNQINEDRIEAGLGIVCEEACRIILENEKPFSLSKIEEFSNQSDGDFYTDFDALPQRSRIIAVIEAEGEFDRKIAELKSDFNLPALYTYDGWLDRLLSLEILDEKWENDLKAVKDKPYRKRTELSASCDRFYERLLTYFVYRYVGVSKNAVNLRSHLAFCILSVEIIRLLFEQGLDAESVPDGKKAPDGLIDWARRYSTEIEYSEDNADELIFAFESAIHIS